MGKSNDALGKIIVSQQIGTNVSWARYFYTGQEYDPETNLWNYRARMYDDDLFRFYSIDPAGQFDSPYIFTGNSPLMYVDPDGELAWFIPILIGAAIGAGTNVATNWDAITQNGFNFGKFFSYAGIGAVSGGVGAISGPFAPLAWASSGAISGAGNAAISSGNVFQGLWMGATTGLVGGKIGQSIAPHFGKVLNQVTVNGTSLSSIPVLYGAIGGGLGGAAVGGAIGFGVGYAQTKTIDGALKGAGEGALSGLKTGAIAGAASASASALAEGRNPFTNNPLRTIVVGENMNERVKPYAERSGAESIEMPKEYENDLNAMKKYNEQWIDRAIKDNARILDRGIDPFRQSPRSFFYKMEQIKIESNLFINPTKQGYYFRKYK